MADAETETTSGGEDDQPRTKTTGTGTKNTPPKKRATKKVAKKVAKKTSAAGTKADKKSSKSAAQQAKYPRHSVEKALRIPRAIYEQNAGNPATRKEAAAYAGGSVTGAFNVEVSSARKYGFLETQDKRLVVTARARQAIAPQSETDRINALRDAILSAPDVSDVYNFYRGENLPDDEFLRNALIDRFKIPVDKTAEFTEVFFEDIRAADLLDESGERPRLLDIGRDESHQKSERKQVKSSVKPEAGDTCFVMQPFAGHLGSYYESIFKPAIKQAGLRPIRADDEIFATGKVMDQIWRGIRSASVLVAELTSKNPNVFYELGLAHALEKPVVLISSNQDDVPFDLRHIRVILYDQTDPFWGQKLIDKIADNVVSALNNPEEAIFRISEDT